jgi:hypothetical protein
VKYDAATIRTLTELFQEALEIAPTEREIFLDHVSESDAELRGELEALLAAEGVALTGKPPDDIAAGYLARIGDCSASLPLLTEIRLKLADVSLKRTCVAAAAFVQAANRTGAVYALLRTKDLVAIKIQRVPH